MSVLEQVPDDDQDRVADGDVGLLGAAASGESMELGGQIGVPGARGRMGCLSERVA